MSFAPLPPLPLWIGPRGGELRIVVLDRAYDTFELSITQKLFPKIIAMKIAGYLMHYPYGALPADSGDFVGTHLLLCEEYHEELFPLMGMKFISETRCQEHCLEFPAFHIVHPKTQRNHYLAIQELLKTSQERGETIAYSASWTMDKKVRSDLHLSRFCKSVNIALFYYYAKTFRIQNLIGAATLRFKVHEWKTFLGYHPIELQGRSLESIPCHPFFEESILIMHLHDFQPEAIRYCRQFEQLWEERLTISQKSVSEKIQEAA